METAPCDVPALLLRALPFCAEGTLEALAAAASPAATSTAERLTTAPRCSRGCSTWPSGSSTAEGPRAAKRSDPKKSLVIPWEKLRSCSRGSCYYKGFWG